MKINSPPGSGLMKGGFTNRELCYRGIPKGMIMTLGMAMSTKAAGLVRAAEVYIKDRLWWTKTVRPDATNRLLYGRGRKIETHRV